MQIESIELRNYRVFREAKLDRLSPMAVVVGANGTGKSTLFDVFSFLKQCLAENVPKAVNDRGGFNELVSRGFESESIGIKLRFRESAETTIEYTVQIGREGEQVYVQKELLHTFRPGQISRVYLKFKDGNQSEDSDGLLAVTIKKGVLALGALAQQGMVPKVRDYIESWYIADIRHEHANRDTEARLAHHLSPTGDNLPQVARHMYEQHRELFDLVLQRMRERLPGMSSVEVKLTEDRLYLRFQDKAFTDPFGAQWVSDGTIKLFAYLVMLHDPNPHPLLAIEEADNQLYPELLAELVEDFRDYARRGGQVLMSTHSPEFVNRLQLDEIFWLVKEGGFSTFRRASDSEILRNLVDEGDLPGTLWKQGLFEGAGPR